MNHDFPYEIELNIMKYKESQSILLKSNENFYKYQILDLLNSNENYVTL